MMKKLLLILSTCSLLVAIIIGAYVGYDIWQSKQVEQRIARISTKGVHHSLKKNVNDDPTAAKKVMDQIDQKEFDPIHDFTVDWAYLRSVNPDVIAWVWIPGTSVSYPVLQEKTIGSFYYINHNLYHHYQELGSVFTPAMENTSKNAETLLFAHNSFGWYGNVYFTYLASWYKNTTTATAYRYAYIYYPNGKVEQYHVWTAKSTTVSDPVYALPQEKDSSEYQLMLNQMSNHSNFVLDSARPTNHDKTLVLSTCQELGHSPYRFFAGFKHIATYQQ